MIKEPWSVFVFNITAVFIASYFNILLTCRHLRASIQFVIFFFFGKLFLSIAQPEIDLSCFLKIIDGYASAGVLYNRWLYVCKSKSLTPLDKNIFLAINH